MVNSSNQPDKTNPFNFDFSNWVLKSSSVFHFVEGYKYMTKIGNSAQTTVLNIMKSADPGPVRGNWLLRFDKAHPGANYPHLNMRHKYTGIQDAHTKLPPGTLTVAKYGGYSAQLLNFLRKFTLVYDMYRLGAAFYKDCRLGIGTFDNTVICLTAIIFEWIGGLAGAAVGAGLGTAVLPGVGTLCGALVGGPTGVHLGAKFASSLTEEKQMENIKARFIKYASKL